MHWRAFTKAFFALVIVGLASVLAYMYLDSLRYHPVVHVDLPGGLSLTAVLQETKERDACMKTNERFLTPFRKCKECKITVARCDRQLEGLELALRKGAPVPYYTVLGRDARVALIGPPDAAKASCLVAAAQMLGKGIGSAACVPPQSGDKA